jgi:hypothetical protein
LTKSDDDKKLEDLTPNELWELLRYYKKLSHQAAINALDEYEKLVEQVTEIEGEITTRDKGES